MKRNWLVGLALVVLSACSGSEPLPDEAYIEEPEGGAEEAAVDEAALQEYDSLMAMRKEVQGKTSSPNAVLPYIAALNKAYTTNLFSAVSKEPIGLVTEARGWLEALITTNPIDAKRYEVEIGRLLYNSGQKDSALKVLHESLRKRNNAMAGSLLAKHYGVRGERSRLIEVCKATQPLLQEDEAKLYAFLDLCVDYSGASTVEEALSWAKPELRQGYAQSRQERRQHGSCRRECEAKRATCRSECLVSEQCLLGCDDALNVCSSACTGPIED